MNRLGVQNFVVIERHNCSSRHLTVNILDCVMRRYFHNFICLPVQHEVIILQHTVHTMMNEFKCT